MQKQSVFKFALKNILDPQADLGQHSSNKITGKRSMWERNQFCLFNPSELTPTSATIPTPRSLVLQRSTADAMNSEILNYRSFIQLLAGFPF